MAHGAILYGTSPFSNKVENQFVLAYHQGEDAGQKYQISLISKRTPTKSPKVKQKTAIDKVIQEETKNNAYNGGATSKPKLVGTFAPPYPQASRIRGEEGDVTLKFTVGIDGRVKNVTVTNSSGFKRLDKNSLDYIRQQLFNPAQIGGTATEMEQELTISYRRK